eukprot:jgi/Botrbrau1/22152/Bobra.0206s0075.1
MATVPVCGRQISSLDSQEDTRKQRHAALEYLRAFDCLEQSAVLAAVGSMVIIMHMCSETCTSLGSLLRLWSSSSDCTILPHSLPPSHLKLLV